MDDVPLNEEGKDKDIDQSIVRIAAHVGVVSDIIVSYCHVDSGMLQARPYSKGCFVTN